MITITGYTADHMDYIEAVLKLRDMPAGYTLKLVSRGTSFVLDEWEIVERERPYVPPGYFENEKFGPYRGSRSDEVVGI